MRRVLAQVESTPALTPLYLAFELGANRWVVAYGTHPSQIRRAEIVGADGTAKAAQLRAQLPVWRAMLGLPAAGPMQSCYEAGRDGTWVHHLAATLGIANTIVDASSIELPRRARRMKTDALDATRLWRLLWRVAQGERDVWRPVRVPAPPEEDARHAARTVLMLTKERTRLRNRLHAALAQHGVRDPLRPTFGDEIPVLTDWRGASLPDGVRTRLTVAWTLLQAVERALRTARRTVRQRVRAAGPAVPPTGPVPTVAPATQAAVQAARLCRLRGLAPISSAMLAQELFVRGLRNRREVGALSGLVPARAQSGETSRDLGVTRSGPRYLRALVVEVAWAWLQWQPASALAQWYTTRYAHGGPRQRKVGIVALARKLLIALWRYLETGTPPAGAIVRAAA